MLWTVAASLGWASISTADVVEVRQVGIEFIPSRVEIQTGDTVRWLWGDDFHTVTHGTGCTPEPQPLFDAPLDPEHMSFEFTFNDPGDVSYFCRPHCKLLMAGVVVVQGEAKLECDGIKKAKFKCRRGTVKWAVTLADNRNEGRKLIINLAGPDPRMESVEVRGKKMKGKFKNVAPGAYVAGIEGCPDFDKELACR